MARRKRTIDEIVGEEVRFATTLDDARARLTFFEKLLTFDRPLVESFRRIADGEYHRLYAGRGERWSDTYSLRKAERDLKEHEAIVAALSELLPAVDTNCPAG
jgi:hypothetical protein